MHDENARRVSFEEILGYLMLKADFEDVQVACKWVSADL